MNLRVEHMGKRIYLLEDEGKQFVVVAEMTSDRDYERRLSQAVHIMKAVTYYEKCLAEADPRGSASQVAAWEKLQEEEE